MKRIYFLLVMFASIFSTTVFAQEDNRYEWLPDYDNPQITDASQFSSPWTDPEEGSLENLLDGDASTFWHSSWHSNPPHDVQGSHYLQVRMPDNYYEDGMQIAFKFMRRNNANQDHTTKWTIYGTNEELETDFANPLVDKELCELLATIETPFASKDEILTSVPFNPKGYKYLRFYSEVQTGGGFGSRVFWHVGDFQIYPMKLTIVRFKEYPSFGRSDLLYYDYDGDGVMEMFGLYDWVKFGLMNDSSIIKTFDLPNLKMNSGSSYYERNNTEVLKLVANGHFPKIANGKGDLNIGNFIIGIDGSCMDLAQILSSSDKNTLLSNLDLDNDGYLDAIFQTNSLMQLHDGSFIETVPKIIQDSAYIASTKTTVVSDPLSFNFIVKGYSSNKNDVRFYSCVMDLNRDGRPDILSKNGKTAFISLDNKSYTQIGFSGLTYPYDLNSDGIIDYLLFDGADIYTVICDSKGKTTQNKIFSNSKVKKFIARDFDLDGDVDVLVFIRDEQNTYFVILRNDGNGTFKKKENYIQKGYFFIECKDYDADGLYEVLLTPENKNLPVNKIVKINQDFSLTDVSENFEGVPSMMIMNLGDFDNDGFTDFKLTNGMIRINEDYNSDNIYYDYRYCYQQAQHFTGHYSKQNKQNTAPQKMNKPIVIFDESTGFLRIVWERGQDAETSACDLTYEVRIGTAPGKDDVLKAPSLADGRRRVIADGGMGTQLQTYFNIAKHPAGTYYIAVQAIDAGGLGGAWSDEATYDKAYAIPDIVANQYQCTVVDTITVIANGSDENVTYQWTVSNGEVISQKGNLARVCFHAAGSQQVKLTTIYKDVKYPSQELMIDVFPFKEKTNFIMLSNSLDLNQDGYPDGLGSYFLVNDGKGNLSKYPKSFNSDLDIYYVNILDINKDGFPDVLAGSNKGKIFINDEEGDFEYEQRDFVINGTTEQNIAVEEWADFTNNGICDAIIEVGTYSGKYSIIRTEDYNIFDLVADYDMIEDKHNKYQICDINRDGFLDIVFNRDAIFYAYINQGNGTFNKVKILEVEEGTKSWCLSDINNDGYMDIITAGYSFSAFGNSFKNYQPLNIYCGNADNTFTLTLSYGSNLGFGTIQDYDNNGYLDIPIPGDKTTLLFDRDMQYHVVTGGKCSSDLFIVMDGNGYPQGRMSSITNEVPKAPSTVSVRQTADGMVINWSDAEDDHTPAAQMRYNISVKRKGKTGADSYVISPMNGGDSKAALVFPWYYKQSTTMTVPNSALKAGETYEVQVQAIDLWNQWSPMSAPVEITIAEEDGVIEVPDMACVDRETTVKFTGVLASDATIDFGTDSKYAKDGNTYSVTWSSEGLKDITLGNHHSRIIVKQPVDVSFTLPDNIYAGAVLPIEINKNMASYGSRGSFRFVAYPNGAHTSVNYSLEEGTAWLSFDKPGDYEIEALCETDVIGNSMKKAFTAKATPNAELGSVDVNDNHYTLSWPTTDQPSDISKVIVYKEEGSLNKFNVLDTVDISRGSYTDLTSAPNVVSARYKIAMLSDGGQTFESKIHKPLHVMVASQATGGYHLMWNAYEGLDADSYRIWRGTSPDNMQLLTQLAGSQQNFTDADAPSGELFYAVSFAPDNAASVKGIQRAPSTGADVHSNVISTRSAAQLVSATSLAIVTLTENPSLTDDNKTLQLYYILLPTYCTCNQVAWSIVEGEELAEISSDGVLTAKGGTGMVRVRVSSIDGSNLTDEITVDVDIKGDNDSIKEITRMATVQPDDVWYTLDGRRLSRKPTHTGIYIRGGKKFVVK